MDESGVCHERLYVKLLWGHKPREKVKRLTGCRKNN
jgi:hypothetical protein